MSLSSQEALKLQSYLQTTFKNDNISLRKRENIDDSVEVFLDNEAIGLIYKDEEDKDDISYDLNMSILAIDIE